MGLCLSITTRELLAQTSFDLVVRAQPDEFWQGLGKIPYIPFGNQPADLPGRPKVNYDYVWSMASDGQSLWFGVGANVAALPYGLLTVTQPREYQSPNGLPYRVWELSASPYPEVPTILKQYLGDWRPPRVFQLNVESGELVERTPPAGVLPATLGFRSAAMQNGVVLMAGPSLMQSGVVMAAFDSESGQFLESRVFRQYSNIRQWALAGGQHYTSVLNTLPVPSAGTVLKWLGDHSDPFRFETVGLLNNQGGYLTEHEGRLYVGTWPDRSLATRALTGNAAPPVAAIWVSPPLGSDGLTTADRWKWRKVWSPAEYEPDPVIVGSYGIGAMASFQGKLYWGTINTPAGGGYALEQRYPGQLSLAETAQGSRACALFSSSTLLEANPQRRQVDLLVGDAVLPVYQPGSRNSRGAWTREPNLTTGRRGRFASSGWDSPLNYYVWSIAIHQGKLYFGTYDASTFTAIGRVLDGAVRADVGGDLWCITPDGSGSRLSTDGLGNSCNHGIRTMVSTSAGLYFGLSNSQNLLGDLEDDLPDGGWEIRRLRP